MKKFDLTAALAGDKVVTRDGRPTSEVIRFKTVKNAYPVVAVIGGSRYNFTIDGKFYDPEEREGDHHFDLFMATKTKTVYVVMYRSQIGGRVISATYETEESANKAFATTLGTIPFTFEDNA